MPLPQHLLELKQRLEQLGQAHLFEAWDSYDEEQQRAFLSELAEIATHYHGGVEQYIRNGRRLLTPCDAPEFTSIEQPPIVFHAPNLVSASDELLRHEKEGLVLVGRTAFVLVAGGLGERLGYDGIKVELPVQSATGTCYLEHYMGWIRETAGEFAPFCIMTSDDTHTRTQALLEKLKYCGLKRVRLLKQATVPCFSGPDAKIALKAPLQLLRKPHGHGDVHSLIYAAQDETGQRSIAEAWLDEGIEHIAFFQDTNAFSILTIPVTLALSAEHNLVMAFTCVPRLPGEAIGLLCHVGDAGGVKRTVNVEYNKFAPLYQALRGLGDVAAPGTTYSAFPGSINTLVYRLAEYVPLLRSSCGHVPEFINPKYADKTKQSFKSPTRIESLMQDFALLFSPGVHRVGGVVFDRDVYQPVKNSISEAVAKYKDGLDAHCAATGDASVALVVRERLRSIGVRLPDTSSNNSGGPPQVHVGPIPIRLFPVVAFDAAFSNWSFASLSARFPSPEKVSLSQRSSLVIEGNVTIRALTLDGALWIRATSSATHIIIDGLVVTNAGSRLVPVDEASPQQRVTPADTVRGYLVVEDVVYTVSISAPGEQVVTRDDSPIITSPL